MGRKKKSYAVTIIDVAEAAGVSYSTVSRVVNNKSYVKEETRQKVLKAMDELGYQANLQARSLAGGHTNVIGLLVVDLATQYNAEIIRGIEDVLSADKKELVLYTTHHRKANETSFVRAMASRLADGLLIVLPRAPEAYVDSLRQRGFPYVLIDEIGKDAADLSVTADNYQGGYSATSHLIGLGHRRIAMITGNMNMTSARHRLEGYQAALADAGIPLDPNLVVNGDFTQQGGRDGAQKLLDLPLPPTAMFAANDDSAAGALEAIHTHGLSVPQDISIVGFDDVPMATVLNPQLTTVKQPLTEIGRRAAQMLLEQIEQPAEEQTSIILPTRLIVRESTAEPIKVSLA